MDDKHLKSILESLDNVSKVPVPTLLEIKIIEQFNQPRIETPIIRLSKTHYLVAASLLLFTILNLGTFLIPESENNNTALTETVTQEYTIATAYELDRSVDYYNLNSTEK